MVGPFHSRVPISIFLSCDYLGALCMFRWPVCYFLPCGIIQSGAPCRAVQGHPTMRVLVGSFRSRIPVSFLLSCDHLGALCTFGRIVCHLLPCGITRLGMPCRVLRGRPTGCVRVGSFRSRAPVSVFLCCDHLSALYTFGRPVFRLFPCGIVRSGAPCRAM